MEGKDYGQIIQVSNSLRKYYGLPLYHDTDAKTDQWLEQNACRCVVAILIDGMGTSVMKKHLPEYHFFPKHTVKEITTVFPPTTSAATTSFRTGKSPIENAWLGWNQYFPELDDNLILFRSQSQYTDVLYPEFISRTIPYKDMVQELQEKGIRSESIWPSWSPLHPCDSYAGELKMAEHYIKQNETRFVYVYWDALDTLMHKEGPSSKEAGEMLRQIELETEQFAKRLPEDCGMMVIADHSQIDIHQKDLEAETELCSCFLHEPALEPRAISFTIREGKKTEFKERFHKLYGKEYHLYTHDEVMQKQLFGTGTPHPRSEAFIGDYLAVAVSDLQLFYKKGFGKKGDHAGGLKEEACIPLILYTNNK